MGVWYIISEMLKYMVCVSLVLFCAGCAGNEDNELISYSSNSSGWNIVDGNVVDGNGEKVQVHLVNNQSAVDPTYYELIMFLENDETNELNFPTYVDTSVHLHNNAEKQGINCGIAAFELSKGVFSHNAFACNVFQTSDRGIIYISANGVEDFILTFSDGKYPYCPLSSDLDGSNKCEFRVPIISEGIFFF